MVKLSTEVELSTWALVQLSSQKMKHCLIVFIKDGKNVENMSTGKLSSQNNEHLTIVFIKTGALDNCLHTTGQLSSVYLAIPSCL